MQVTNKAFSDPNDTNKDPVNRMIHKLLALKDKTLREMRPAKRRTSHGNVVAPSKEEIAVEEKSYAKLKAIAKLIKRLESVVS
tara:strand:+ start:5300 stop:5548 length:249 start_codon:yes stop_codon:yes gene_type:complete